MHIQPCTSKNGVKNATVNFSSQKSSAYYSYMSEKSNDIVTISSLGGACIGVISAKDNLRRESVSKIAHSAGFATLALFTITSLNFLISKEYNSKKKN